MPSDAPLAVVLVQHLSRTHESQLPEILATRTALRVFTATDGVRVESGHVYVIPPDTHMTVIDGHLRVRPRPKGDFSVQIDALFRLLPSSTAMKAVGVVLVGRVARWRRGLSGDPSSGRRDVCPASGRSADRKHAARRHRDGRRRHGFAREGDWRTSCCGSPPCPRFKDDHPSRPGAG